MWALTLISLTVATALPLTLNTVDFLQFIYDRPHTTMSNPCAKALQYIANNFTSNLATNLLLFSGKGINDFGNPHECVKSNESRHLMMNAERMKLNVTLGMCVPKQCHPNDFSMLKSPIAALITKMVYQMLPPNTSFAVNLTEGDIVFMDPEEQQSKLNIFSPMFWFAASYFALYLLASVYGCIYWKNHSRPSDKSKMSLKQKVLSAFDLQKNYYYLITPSMREEEDLKSFNGIRVLAMMWVMLGHVFWFCQKSPVSNPQSILDMPINPYLSFLYNATYSVDIFFFLSAFLMAYLTLKHIKENNGKLPFLQIYLHRIIRLYPLLIAAFLLYVYIIPAFGNGPIFPLRHQTLLDKCNNEWYYVLFFAVDFENAQDSCMGWTWYLGCDMQFFLITPPILYMLYKKGSLGIIVNLVIVFGSNAWSALLANKYNLSYVNLKYSSLFDVYYPRPYVRAPAYFMGLLFGYTYFLYRTSASNCINKATDWLKKSLSAKIVIHLIGFGGMAFIIQIMYYMNLHYLEVTKTEDVLYFTFSRSLFMTFLFVFLIPSIYGKSKLVNALFGHTVFEILCKFTYCAYLIHLCFITFFNNTIIQSNVYSTPWLFWTFWSYYAVVMIVSCAMCAVFESPVVVLEGTFLFPRKSAKSMLLNKCIAEDESTKLAPSTKIEVVSS